MRNKIFYWINIIFLSITIVLFVKFIHNFSLNVPLWDDYDSCLNFLNQWITAPSLSKKIFFLLQQHNEHRIIVPKLIELAYYYSFGTINFKWLILIGIWLLLVLIAVTYYAVKDTINSGYQFPVFVMVCMILLSTIQFEMLVWIGASLQQYSQILFSLLGILILAKYLDQLNKEHGNSFYFILYSIIIFINACCGGGWIALAISTSIFLLLKKYIKLFMGNFLLFIIIAVFYFKISPYTFYHNPPPHFKAYIEFIIGFLGNGFFENKFSYVAGIGIIAFIGFYYKPIKQNNTLLLWLIFIMSNALLIGVARAHGGGDDLGFPSRYSIYSLINMVFIITFFLQDNDKFHLVMLINCIIFIAFVFVYIAVTKPSSYTNFRYSVAKASIFYPAYARAESVYLEARHLGYFQSSIIDNYINKVDNLMLTQVLASKLVLPTIELSSNNNNVYLNQFSTTTDKLLYWEIKLNNRNSSIKQSKVSSIMLLSNNSWYLYKIPESSMLNNKLIEGYILPNDIVANNYSIFICNNNSNLNILANQIQNLIYKCFMVKSGIELP